MGHITPHPIGTRFSRPRSKRTEIETVTDILTTYNNAGDIVHIRYVASHEFCGQTVTDNDVLHTTISRGKL